MSLAQDDNDECPICHSKRYLRRDMRFLINPECYHKMCESCVDRIFAHGPAACPVAGCNKTLRRHRFRIPTFDDLTLEREVDIRRQVARVFNRREDEFESLRDYNDYLNRVEDITFNLISGIDVEETHRQLREYAESNADSIAENKKLEQLETQELQQRTKAQEETSRRLRTAAHDEEETTRKEKDDVRRRVIESLASGGDAFSIAREGSLALKKPGQKRVTEPISTATTNYSGQGFTIAGLRKRGAAAEPERPYDAFAGMGERRDFVTMPDACDGWDVYLGRARKEPKYIAAGYDVREFYTRALVEAFSGLGVFVDEEYGRKEARKKKRVEAGGGGGKKEGSAVGVKIES